MNIPTWTSPALYGAAFGAAALAIVGFSYGGWVSASTARKTVETQTAQGIAAALLPYCVEKAKSDPVAAKVLADLKAARGYNRRGVVEAAGWATPLGSDKPNTALGGLCEEALGKSV
jgi:alpha/beta superfamily hydrolase